MAVVLFIGTYWNYLTETACLSEGTCLAVEGKVTNFIPYPRGGHGRESFEVGGQRFSYIGPELTSGFKNIPPANFPMRDGLYVRITYWKDVPYTREVILRLEIGQ